MYVSANIYKLIHEPGPAFDSNRRIVTKSEQKSYSSSYTFNWILKSPGSRSYAPCRSNHFRMRRTHVNASVSDMLCNTIKCKWIVGIASVTSKQKVHERMWNSFFSALNHKTIYLSSTLLNDLNTSTPGPPPTWRAFVRDMRPELLIDWYPFARPSFPHTQRQATLHDLHAKVLCGGGRWFQMQTRTKSSETTWTKVKLFARKRAAADVNIYVRHIPIWSSHVWSVDRTMEGLPMSGWEARDWASIHFGVDVVFFVWLLRLIKCLTFKYLWQKKWRNRFSCILFQCGFISHDTG